MTVKHDIAEPFRAHIADTRQKIGQVEATALQLRGQVALLEQDATTMRRHLGVVIGLIEKQADLPASKLPYALSDDGAFLVGETENKL